MSESERATPEMYRRVFDGHHEGRIIFEDLRKRFGFILPYRRGGRAAARDTDYYSGQWSVFNFIVNQVNRDPTDPNLEGDDGNSNSRYNSAGPDA